MKIAATVILYYPKEFVINNIKSYVHSVERLYIVDNSEIQSMEILQAFTGFENIIYLHDGDNKGIALRLNHVCNLAIKEGFDWILTMDQDSSFEETSIKNYFKCVTAFAQKEKVSIFGINYSTKISASDICDPEVVNELITSGSILNLSAFPVIKGFDEKLFIDEVDFDYCLRSIINGFELICFPNIFLNHELGETLYYRSFKSIKLTPRVLHTPVRMYYMVRNFFYIKSRYREIFDNEINERKKILLNRLKNNILYNRQRFKVIKYIAKGFWDYRKNCMGKLNN
jgi:rhamnosyltransferase